MSFSITPKMLDVLGVLLEDPSEPRYGLEIGERLDMRSGTLYPILGRLERAGLLSSELEKVDPRTVGRGRRRFYRLTGIGEVQAKHAAEEQLVRLQRALKAGSQRRPTLQPHRVFP
jgi:PadR family transcriptional regulator, regulatory protein PadR